MLISSKLTTDAGDINFLTLASASGKSINVWADCCDILLIGVSPLSLSISDSNFLPSNNCFSRASISIK